MRYVAPKLRFARCGIGGDHRRRILQNLNQVGFADVVVYRKTVAFLNKFYNEVSRSEKCRWLFTITE